MTRASYVKILNAAALKNVVTSKRAWVVTLYGKKRNLKISIVHMMAEASHNNKQIQSENQGFAVMTSCKRTRELLARAYLADIISDKEFVLLYYCSFSKTLELPYEE